MGPPSWGSGSHRVRVRERYPLLCYANANELLRNEIQAKTPFGIEAQNQIMQGNPVSDDQLMGLVLRYLRTPACSMGFILEGMPRSPEQAERLVEEQRRIDAIVEVDVPDEECVKRMSGRLIHRPSGRIYHEHFAPPRVAGKDDVTGEQLTKRLDDDPNVAKEKLKNYRNSIEGVKRYFKGLDPYPTTTASSESNNTTTPATTAGNDQNATTTTTTEQDSSSSSPKKWTFPSRLPVFRDINGKGPTEEVRSRLFSTLDELVGKRATGPHQQRFWWSWFS